MIFGQVYGATIQQLSERVVTLQRCALFELNCHCFSFFSFLNAGRYLEHARDHVLQLDAAALASAAAPRNNCSSGDAANPVAAGETCVQDADEASASAASTAPSSPIRQTVLLHR
jgi:hypothetical protein